MRILLMGAPGAGKGTQALLLTKRAGVPHISPGEMLRHAVSESTPMGLAAKSYMDKGVLVPDEIIIDMMRERLSSSDCKKGFILDGFPRNLQQAEALEGMLREIGMPLEAAVNVDVPQALLMDRTCGRRVCSCGATYHMKHHLPRVAGKCDYCGRDLILRKDDVPEVVAERLRTYEVETRPLIEYYQARGILKNVDGQADVETVYQRIIEALEKR